MSLLLSITVHTIGRTHGGGGSASIQKSTMTQAHAHGGVVWCGRSVEWSGMVWCGVELVCRNTHNGGEQGLRGTQQAPNSTATGDIQHIET